MTIRTIIGMGAVALLMALLGASAQWRHDRAVVEAASRAEWQAEGLESECKSTLAEEIQTSFKEEANGDYRLSVYGGRRIACEEKDVRIASQPDAANPLVVECSHN